MGTATVVSQQVVLPVFANTTLSAALRGRGTDDNWEDPKCAHSGGRRRKVTDFEELVDEMRVADRNAGMLAGWVDEDSLTFRKRDAARAAVIAAYRELETRCHEAEHAEVAWVTGDFGELMEDDE
jgi:hypothetical protein